jgi:choline dehydrogenase-like flavoprotein
MPIHTTYPPSLTPNVVIAGGSTAGCVGAARLASALPHLVVLVVEAGPNGAGLPTVVHPTLFFAHFAPGSATSTLHLSRPEAGLADRRVVIACGKMLGGSSALNGSAYVRPPAADLDDWGVPGWSGAKMLERFKRFETYHGKGDPSVHGHDGPVHVSGGMFRTPRAEDAFLEAAQKVGFEPLDDAQGMHPAAVNAAERMLRFVSPVDGRRQGAASRYLLPRLEDGEHPNLQVLVGH